MRLGLPFVILTLLLPAVCHAQQPKGPYGRWHCNAATGPAVLDFVTSKVLTYGGVQMRYRILGTAIQVIEDGLPANYAYVLAGDRLDITSPAGDRIACTRAPAPAQEAGGPGGSLNHLLQGQICSYSGSSSSGSSYSSTLRAFFDGRGRFTTGSESSFSVTNRDYQGDETSSAQGYGSGGGPGGTYEVTSATVGAPIRIRWDTGEEDVAYVHHVVGGRITEVKYGDKLFGAPLCE